MTPTEIAREIVYPLTHAAVLMTMVFLFAMVSLASYGGVLGLILLFLVLPALFRYLMVLLSWRARGLETPTLDIDHLQWFGNAWSIFPALLAVAIGTGWYAIASRFGGGPAYVFAIVLIAVMPASLAVLAITHSPLQSVKPTAVAAVVRRCGGDYWIAPTFAVLAIFVIALMIRVNILAPVRHFSALYFLFAGFALIGGVIRRHQLIDDVEIPQPSLPDEVAIQADLESKRSAVLGHAYGFISRGNRAGGFRHIEDWLRHDPDPRAARAWFFQRMLDWENTEPALLFGQSCLRHLLHDGDRVGAVKLMLRCRLENEQFIPLADDIPLAIEAAEACGNQQLAAFLRSRV